MEKLELGICWASRMVGNHVKRDIMQCGGDRTDNKEGRAFLVTPKVRMLVSNLRTGTARIVVIRVHF